MRNIFKADSSRLSFSYDLASYRWVKPLDWKSQMYIRDASRNLLALNEHINITKDFDTGRTKHTVKFGLQEMSLYGSASVGLQRFFDAYLSKKITKQCAGLLLNPTVIDYWIAGFIAQGDDRYFEISVR